MSGNAANRSQLVSQTATKGANELLNLAYDYDAGAGQSGVNSTAGNTHQLISLSGTINGTTESASYTYDNLRRLVTSTQTSNGASAQRTYSFDRWGNRTAAYDDNKGIHQIQSIALEQSGGAPTNRITSVTNDGSPSNYVYDAAGNVTNDGAHTYSYDAANRLVSVDGGATAQYRYDHQNQRVTKIVGSSWTHYIWEGGQVIGEHDATTAYTTNPPYQENSARLDYIYARGRMIHTRERTSSTAPWTTLYYVSDVWSTRLVLDASGNVFGRQGHLAFGEEFAQSGTQEKHHFTTYESENEIGTDYAVNRHYSQSVGRFASADPYQASSYLVNPQSWNRYSYVENDPIHNVDPLGLLLEYPGPGADPCCAAGFCGGGFEPPQDPARCDVILPTHDSDQLIAVITIFGEASPSQWLGTRQYRDGDRVGSPTGVEITEEILFNEALLIASVIVNRSERNHQSLREVVEQPDQFAGLGKGLREYPGALLSSNGSPQCEKLRRATAALSFVLSLGVVTFALNFRAVLQEDRNGNPFIRRQRRALRMAGTDFF